MKTTMKLLSATALALMAAAPAQAQVLFWSTQAAPVEETQKMREDVLAGFEGGVDFQPQEVGPFITRLEAEISSSRNAACSD